MMLTPAAVIKDGGAVEREEVVKIIRETISMVDVAAYYDNAYSKDALAETAADKIMALADGK
jgi:hypothetical protein